MCAHASYADKGLLGAAHAFGLGGHVLLAEMYTTTSGLKVLVTTTAIQNLETARRSMSGHGFSEFAGVGRLYADYVPPAKCIFLYLNVSTYGD